MTTLRHWKVLITSDIVEKKHAKENESLKSKMCGKILFIGNYQKITNDNWKQYNCLLQSKFIFKNEIKICLKNLKQSIEIKNLKAKFLLTLATKIFYK